MLEDLLCFSAKWGFYLFNRRYVPVAHGAVLHLWSVGSLRWSTVARDTGETHLHASKMALQVAPVVDQVGTPELCGHNQRRPRCFGEGWRPKNLRIDSSSLLGSSFPRNPLTFQNRGIPGNTVLGGGAYRQLQVLRTSVHVHKGQMRWFIVPIRAHGNVKLQHKKVLLHE